MDSNGPGQDKYKKSESDEAVNEESFVFNRNNIFIDKDCPVIKEDSKES